VKLFFQSSSRIRHKSDSIQLTVSLQRDRKENDAESFHCDRIVPPNSATRAMRRKSHVKKSAAQKSRKKFAAEKFQPQNAALKFLETETSRHENGRAYDEDAAETSPTRRSEIRGP
jgi:hypothetical protein